MPANVLACFISCDCLWLYFRRPRVDWKRPDILLRDLVLWFASRDLHIATTFARRFYWTELNMWPEDLPKGKTD